MGGRAKHVGSERAFMIRFPAKPIVDDNTTHGPFLDILRALKNGDSSAKGMMPYTERPWKNSNFMTSEIDSPKRSLKQPLYGSSRVNIRSFMILRSINRIGAIYT